MSGNTIIVGAYLDDDDGAASGSAYIFVRSNETWTQQQKLTADDGASLDIFGDSVAIDGNTAVIGATWDNSKAGAAYVFTRNNDTWSQQQKLTASDGGANDSYGISVAIDGSVIIVGAYRENHAGNGNDSGAAYVYTLVKGWGQEQKLTASNAAASGRFGASVAIDGETALVGAYGGNGSAYIFGNNAGTWGEQKILTASDAESGDQFGFSVALSSDTAVIGAYTADTTSTTDDKGAAYVFVGSGTTWNEQEIITASDGAASDQFGRSVAVSGNTLIGGALKNDNDGKGDAGAAYLFTRSALSVNLSGAGSGTVSSSPAGINCGGDCDEVYDYGIVVTLTAAANNDSYFTGWSGACSGTGNCVVTMNIAQDVTANFALKSVLSVSLSGTGGGTVSSAPAGINCAGDCNEAYDPGTAVTLTATPNNDSFFAGWSGVCSGLGNCIVTMNEDQAVTANFAPYHYIYLPMIIKP